MRGFLRAAFARGPEGQFRFPKGQRGDGLERGRRLAMSLGSSWAVCKLRELMSLPFGSGKVLENGGEESGHKPHLNHEIEVERGREWAQPFCCGSLGLTAHACEPWFLHLYNGM